MNDAVPVFARHLDLAPLGLLIAEALEPEDHDEEDIERLVALLQLRDGTVGCDRCAEELRRQLREAGR